MSFWKNLLSGFGTTAKDVFIVSTLTGLVVEAKASVDKQLPKLTQLEKEAVKVGIDHLAERIRNSLDNRVK